MKLGIVVDLLLTVKRVRRTMVACVDDIDFFANCEECVANMQKIINLSVIV